MIQLSTPLPSLSVFKHKNYFESESRYRIFSSWLSYPLATCLMPVMIVVLFQMLLGLPIESTLKFGTPIAGLLAAGWTLLQMSRIPAFVAFDDNRVLIKTFLEASTGISRARWHYVIDVKTTGATNAPKTTSVTYGHTSYLFKATDWKDLSSLTQQLHLARENYNITVQKRVSEK